MQRGIGRRHIHGVKELSRESGRYKEGLVGDWLVGWLVS